MISISIIFSISGCVCLFCFFLSLFLTPSVSDSADSFKPRAGQPTSPSPLLLNLLPHRLTYGLEAQGPDSLHRCRRCCFHYSMIQQHIDRTSMILPCTAIPTSTTFLHTTKNLEIHKIPSSSTSLVLKFKNNKTLLHHQIDRITPPHDLASYQHRNLAQHRVIGFLSTRGSPLMVSKEVLGGGG